LFKSIACLLLGLLTAPFINAKKLAMKKILIVYGSFAGSTKEIAERMKSRLVQSGCSVVVDRPEAL
jgi:sulfite reductase alpha subunit-like flavoprotein